MRTPSVNCSVGHVLHLINGCMGDLVFAVCCLLVVAISVHDAMLVVLPRNVIHEFEQNPFGLWLIELQGGDVSLFVWIKFMGTSVVCTALIMLYQTRRRLAILVSSGLAMCQITLLWYLSFG